MLQSSDGEDLQEGKEAEYKVMDEEGKEEEEEEAKMELWDEEEELSSTTEEEEEEEHCENNSKRAKESKRKPRDRKSSAMSACPFCAFECLHLSTLMNHVSRMHFKRQLLQQMEDHGGGVVAKKRLKRGVGKRGGGGYQCPECRKPVNNRELLVVHWGGTHRKVLGFLHGAHLVSTYYSY